MKEVEILSHSDCFDEEVCAVDEEVGGETVRSVSFERFQFRENACDFFGFEGSVNFVSVPC